MAPANILEISRINILRFFEFASCCIFSVSIGNEFENTKRLIGDLRILSKLFSDNTAWMHMTSISLAPRSFKRDAASDIVMNESAISSTIIHLLPFTLPNKSMEEIAFNKSLSVNPVNKNA
jgi:hypothetical protein